MEAVLSRLKGLSADELREEFARANLKCGPITATTRAIFERKLARALVGPEISETDTGTASVETSNNVTKHVTPVQCAPTVATAVACSSTGCGVGEDQDFGYGFGLNPPEEEEISINLNSSDVSHSKSLCETPSKPAQTSPTCFYGVCPPWEDVLSRIGEFCFVTILISDVKPYRGKLIDGHRWMNINHIQRHFSYEVAKCSLIGG